MTMSRVRKRQPSFQISWKLAIHVIFFISFVIVGILYIDQPKSLPQFPIKEVKVIGARHINHQEVQRALTPLVSKGFFGVEVEAIKDKIMQISWVSEVSVRRIWPNQVWVMIVEKNPIASWNKMSLLSSGGDLFIPHGETVPSDLPSFTGPEGKQIYMLQYYNRINSLLRPLHFKVAHLELTPAHLWSVTLNNGMKLTVDHKDFLTRFSHFVKVYPRIIGDRAADVDYIDLRYPNGFAVRWKTVT